MHWPLPCLKFPGTLLIPYCPGRLPPPAAALSSKHLGSGGKKCIHRVRSELYIMSFIVHFLFTYHISTSGTGLERKRAGQDGCLDDR